MSIETARKVLETELAALRGLLERLTGSGGRTFEEASIPLSFRAQRGICF
jgi:hypothetical protein